MRTGFLDKRQGLGLTFWVQILTPWPRGWISLCFRLLVCQSTQYQYSFKHSWSRWIDEIHMWCLVKSKCSASVDIAIMIILLLYKSPLVALGVPGMTLTSLSEITGPVSVIPSIYLFKNNCRLEVENWVYSSVLFIILLDILKRSSSSTPVQVTVILTSVFSAKLN